MAVFTFVCRHDGDSWSAKQHGGELEGHADSEFELQRHLSKLALSSAGSGAIASSFSFVTPSSAVCQIIIGGGGGGGAVFGGGGGVPAASGGAGAPAAEEKKEEEKKEEEESDDDMGFSLFD